MQINITTFPFLKRFLLAQGNDECDIDLTLIHKEFTIDGTKLEDVAIANCKKAEKLRNDRWKYFEVGRFLGSIVNMMLGGIGASYAIFLLIVQH